MFVVRWCVPARMWSALGFPCMRNFSTMPPHRRTPASCRMSTTSPPLAPSGMVTVTGLCVDPAPLQWSMYLNAAKVSPPAISARIRNTRRPQWRRRPERAWRERESGDRRVSTTLNGPGAYPSPGSPNRASRQAVCLGPSPAALRGIAGVVVGARRPTAPRGIAAHAQSRFRGSSPPLPVQPGLQDHRRCRAVDGAAAVSGSDPGVAQGAIGLCRGEALVVEDHGDLEDRAEGAGELFGVLRPGAGAAGHRQ